VILIDMYSTISCGYIDPCLAFQLTDSKTTKDAVFFKGVPSE
jgi:hypothetical protein